MIMQPPSPPKSKIRTFLKAEGERLIAMPTSTLLLLGIFTLVLIWFDPVLPFVGYGLWIWAAHSWQWKSRWASIRKLAQQGGWFVAWLCILAFLADANIWFFPALESLVQSIWHATHLPGDLGLAPFKNDLFARCVLLLPVAPAVALVYERIEPRTQVNPQRRLLASDLVTPTVPPPTASQQSAATPPSEPKEDQKDQATGTSAPTPEPKQDEKKKRPPRSTRTTSKPQTHEPPEAEQLTIDSFLATSPDQGKQQQKPTTNNSTRSTTGTTRTTGTGRKKQQDVAQQQNASTSAPSSPPVPQQKPPEVINWDDVAE